MTDDAEHRAFAQVVLFLLSRAPRGSLGVTKLWKLLYYVDFMHAQQFGTKVTRLPFTKKRHGPAPVGGDALLEELARAKAIDLEKVRRFKHYQYLCRSHAAPDLRDFSFSERAVLEEVALDWMLATTHQLEMAIRESEPWKAAAYGEVLPIERNPLAA